MEVKHLRTFASAATHLSFTEAASELGITQAAVSQQLAALERELEVQLFERAHRRVELTEAGRRLQDYARRILRLVEEATWAVRAEPATVEGVIRVAASSVPAEWLVPELLARFRERYPQVEESLTVSDTELACRAILDGTADVAFVGKLPASERLDARPVADDELQLVVAANHRLAKRRQISVEQLLGEPLLIREPESATRHCVEVALAERGIRTCDLKIALQVNSNDAIRAAIDRGVGAAFLSTRSVRGDVKAGRFALLRIRGLRFTRQLYLVTLNGAEVTSPLKEFVEVGLARRA